MKSKNMIRLVSFVLALGLIAAACGRSDNKSEGTSGGTSETTASEGGAKTLKPVPGFDGTTIKLGVLSALTDRVAIIGKPLTAGNKAWFDYLNAEKGGIAGKYKVELDVQDTKYDPPTGVQVYNGVKNNVVMFAQILGTPVVNAVLPQLRTDKVVAQPGSLDSLWIKEQNLLPIGGPYQLQAINAIDYWYNNGGKGKTACAMSQDDPYGKAGMVGVNYVAGKLGVKVAAQPTFKVTDQDFTAQINQLKGAKCEMVFLVATAASMSGIMTAAVQQGFNTQWIGQSPSWLGVFAKTPLAPYLQKNFWLASEGPLWGDTSAAGMKQYMEIHDKYAADVAPGDQYFGFGFNAARAVTALLEKAVELGDLSRDGILEAINALGDVSFEGMLGDYTYGPPAKRRPPTASTIFKIDPAKPNGLDIVKADYEASSAKAFKFDE